jgi:hypothetical protein
MLKIIGGSWCGVWTTIGLYSYKVHPYSDSSKDYPWINRRHKIEYEDIGFLLFFPVINIPGIPFTFGSLIGYSHDSLLYKLNPSFYQNQIEDFKKMEHEKYIAEKLESEKRMLYPKYYGCYEF